MAEWKCQQEMCNEQASMHFSEVTSNQSKETDLCVTHGNELIARHQQQFGDPTASNWTESAESIDIECFVHFLFIYPSYEPPYGYVELKEKLGIRVFGFTVDLYAISEIHRALTRLKLPRPHPHDLIIKVLDGLGGNICAVNIYQLSAEHTIFGSSTHIQRDDESEEFTVDMRASDAIALALLDMKPIFVPDELLT